MNVTDILRILRNQFENTDLRAGAEQELTSLLCNLEAGEITNDGSYTYDDSTGRAEKFMVAGGGPSAWAVFVEFSIDDVVGYLEFSDSSGTTIVHIPDLYINPLRNALRIDSTTRNAR